MVNIFLKAKHWQLFILMIGIPIGGYIYFLTRFFKIIELQEQQGSMISPEMMIAEMKPFLLVMVIPLFFHFVWLYALGRGVQDFIKPELKLKTGLFTATLFFPLLYTVGAFYLMNDVLNVAIQDLDYEPPLGLVAIVPLNFLSMGCIIYNYYFIAKTLKTAETQAPVRFGDFIGEFFLLIFYIIGIWIIQPKVNALQEPIAGDLLGELHD